MKYLYILFFLFFSFHMVQAQESFRFEWEETDNVSPKGAIIDSEANLVIVGDIGKVKQNYERDGFIFSMAPNGEYNYFRYPAPQDSSIFFTEIIEIDNNNYIVVGAIGLWDYDNPQTDFFALRFDSQMNLISEKRYNFVDKGYRSSSIVRCLIEENGNVLCAGSVKRIEGQPINIHDLAIIRMTQEGDTIETSFQHYLRNVGVHDLKKIPDSENYLILEFITQLYGEVEWFILRPDLTKDTSNYFYSYDYTIGQLNSDYWYPDKDMMTAGNMDLDNSPERAFGVFRSDTLAHISDELFLNRQGVREMHAFKQTMAYADEHSIYVAGIDYDFICHTPDSILLYVVDTALNQVAYKSLGGDTGYELAGVLTAKDHGAYLYGKAWHTEGDACNGNLVIYYVSRDELGLPPVKVFEINNREEQGLAYPNPACDYVNIQLPETARTGTARIRLFNSNGKKVYDYLLPSGGNTAYLQISNLSSGVYIYHIVDNETVLTQGKFVKQ